MSGMFRVKKYLHISGRQEESRPETTRPETARQETEQEKSRATQPAMQLASKIQCPSCRRELDRSEIIENNYICTACGSYFRVRTNNRLRMVCDRGSFTPWFEEIVSDNPLQFPGYEEKLQGVREKTGLREGITVGQGTIYGERACLGVCDSRFLMGSMGQAVGEKIALAVERATKEKLPVVLFCCSGGARMQEGILSLMQMAKTSAALKKHSDAGLLYVSVLTDPTTGGVTASFAMLGDIILAEPGALIGFAGPRVIEQTIGQKLPEGFQSAEFQLDHGFVDRIVERHELKKVLYQILNNHRLSGKYSLTEAKDSFSQEIASAQAESFLPSELSRERQVKSPERTSWQKVKEARGLGRPSALTYINLIFEDFMEFYGDRCYGDDRAIVGGIARLAGRPVTVIGVQKGNDVKECARRNYGMPSPEGYRKALRLMKQAEKFHRPIICLVNTSGAYPGMEAEQRGQGEAIARNLFEMSGIQTPILSVIIGEGGSGGALGLALGNEVWMLENSTYSILSPEGFASILWKDGKRAKEAAQVMGITADDLKRLGVVETIVPEYGGADSVTVRDIAGFMKVHMKAFLERFEGMDGEEIARQRYERFRKF